MVTTIGQVCNTTSIFERQAESFEFRPTHSAEDPYLQSICRMVRHMSEENGAQKMISFRGVSKSFDGGETYAVKDLSLDIGEGEFIVLVGPSGCGKTTTLKMVNRLVEPTSGEIFLRGKNILDGDPVKLRRSLGYVIQSIGLLPHRTIAQNIATVPSLLGWEEDRVQGRVDELVELLELDPVMLGRYPSELSGGQLQRVGVARAIAADPPVMLMDEPFGAVDPIVRGRLQDEFMDLQDRLKKTIIFVTHDIDEAIKMADRIAILNVGGVLEQYDSPEQILSEPATGFVERFVGFERGLKRLSLRKVADIPVEDGPIVRVGDSAESARAELARTEFDWVAVLDGRRVLGWIDEETLGESRVVTTELASRFVAGVTPNSSLREAIDMIVRSRTNVAVVTDDDNNYIGILTQEHISKEIIA